jgi:formyltetrahydrofolate-dependent phosphoribosylglycinamide formyltransferase
MRLAMGMTVTGQMMRQAGHGGHDSERSWRLGVLLSGSGRTLDNLLQVIDRGEMHVEIVVAVSSRSAVRGVEIARDAAIPVETITRNAYPDAGAHSRAIYDAVEPYRPDLLILAGYLRQMVVDPEWEGRMLNIHPALLPQAAEYAAGRGRYGDAVHAAVLDRGDTVSGATVHVVADAYDTGPPVLQCEVPVLPDDTVTSLAARVFAAECELYPDAIRRYMAAHPELRRGARAR